MQKKKTKPRLRGHSLRRSERAARPSPRAHGGVVFFFGGAAGEGEGRGQELRDEGSWDVHSSEAPATGGNWVEIGFFFFALHGLSTPPRQRLHPQNAAGRGGCAPAGCKGGGQKRCPPLPGCSSELNER